jgi:hypothetical protein
LHDKNEINLVFSVNWIRELHFASKFSCNQTIRYKWLEVL